MPSLKSAPEWRLSPALTSYPDAIAEMEKRVAAIQAGEARELIWLLEHPPIYTAGTSAKAQDLLNANGLPVYETGRGGQYTWHGPGQRIVYLMLDLNQRGRDLRCYVRQLENWVIAALDRFSIPGGIRPGRTGIWIARKNNPLVDDKIAAIGVRVKRWVTLHGLCVNINPDLSSYQGIVPCGIRDHGVTSLAALGYDIEMPTFDQALRATWDSVFNPGNAR